MANSFGGDPGFQSTGSSGGLNIQALLQLLSGGMGQYQNFIHNPTRSPLYQNQLSGLLKSLEPSEARATTNLEDIFRNAGNMSSGIYGTAAGNLQGDLVRNRQVMASQLLGQMFPQMTQALFQPMSLYSSLLQSMGQQQPGQQQNTNPWANIPPSVGLGPENTESQLVNQGTWQQHYA